MAFTFILIDAQLDSEFGNFCYLNHRTIFTLQSSGIINGASAGRALCLLDIALLTGLNA